MPAPGVGLEYPPGYPAYRSRIPHGVSTNVAGSFARTGPRHGSRVDSGKRRFDERPRRGDNGPDRQTRPIARRIAGESRAVRTPEPCPASTTCLGSILAPASASTSGRIASRCSVSTAMIGASPASANAVSMSRRIEVPGGVVTSGTVARSAIVSRRRGSGDDGGSATTSSWSSRCSLTSPALVDRQLRQADLGLTAADPGRDGRGVFGLVDVHDDPGCARRNAPTRRGQRVDSERRERDEIESSGFEPGHGGDGRAQHRPVPEELAGRLHERGASRRDHHPATDPMEELDAELLLEPRDPLRERGLGHVQRFCRSREAAVFDHPEHVLDLTEFHPLTLWDRSEQSVGLFDQRCVQWTHGTATSTEQLGGERRDAARRGAHRRLRRVPRRAVRQGRVGDRHAAARPGRDPADRCARIPAPGDDPVDARRLLRVLAGAAHRLAGVRVDRRHRDPGHRSGRVRDPLDRRRPARDDDRGRDHRARPPIPAPAG